MASRKNPAPRGDIPGTEPPQIEIASVQPLADGGRHAIKRAVGEWVTVTAEVESGGRGQLVVALLFRHESESQWSMADMQRVGPGLFTASFQTNLPGRQLYTVEAWFEEGTASKPLHRSGTAWPQELAVLVERERARCGAWYQMFPRSCGADGKRSGTLREAEARLDDIRRMGFDVVLLSPIHPIGRTRRRGPDNAPIADDGDPGNPWAVGSRDGGHTAVDPALGELADFDHFVTAARERGLEVAMELALDCSPDHPWVKKHPGWFVRGAKPDSDILPLDFGCSDWKALWGAWLEVVEFWCMRGVHAFRVAHPGDKPVAFWEWLLAEVRRGYPDAIFLAESTAHAGMTDLLAKAGFSQSLSGFAQLDAREKIIEHFHATASAERLDIARENLFCNTPDLLPTHLQSGGRAAFIARAILASTLGASWGIYSGFELCEGEALPGTEHYAHSEKYEFRARQWNRPGHIKEYMARLNRIRRQHPALQSDASLEFHATNDDSVLFYSKAAEDSEDIVLVAVNLAARERKGAWLELPLERLGIEDDTPFQAHDLIGDTRFLWKGRYAWLEFDPKLCPGYVMVVRKMKG